MRAAARAWAFSRLGRADPQAAATLDEDVAAQFEAMGHRVDPSQISRQESEAFKVAPSNWDSVMAFLACDTQWRAVAAPSGLIWTGLDYAGVDVALRRHDFPASVFADLQVMEIAALSVLGGASA